LQKRGSRGPGKQYLFNLAIQLEEIAYLFHLNYPDGSDVSICIGNMIIPKYIIDNCTPLNPIILQLLGACGNVMVRSRAFTTYVINPYGAEFLQGSFYQVRLI